MQSSSTSGSCTPTTLPPSQERTKGGNTGPTVPPPRSPGPSLLGPPLPPFGAPYIPRTQVNLGRLVGPPKGITPFMVAGLVRTPATKEEGRGSPALESLTRGTMDLSITDRSATPYHRPDSPSLTPNEANPDPNGSGFDSPPRLSPLGNRIIWRVIRLPTSTCTRPAAGHPGAFTDACPSDSKVRRVWFRH
jgi:hypothetical protein